MTATRETPGFFLYSTVSHHWISSRFISYTVLLYHFFYGFQLYYLVFSFLSLVIFNIFFIILDLNIKFIHFYFLVINIENQKLMNTNLVETHLDMLCPVIVIISVTEML